MKSYKIKGNFKAGSQWSQFNTDVEAESENHAVETILSTIGSKHKLKRKYIKVELVEECSK